MLKKFDWRHWGKLLLGAMILAFGMYNVHSRCAITEGGVLGLTLLIRHWFGVSPGFSGPLLDGLCYLIGWRVLGFGFLKNAVVASLGFSGFYNLFSWVGPLLPDLSAHPLAAALVGGAFVGVGVGIVVREGGASGGDDALAQVISKALRCRISRAYLLTDFTVLLLSLSYIPWQRIAYSLVTVTLSSLIIDWVQRFGKKNR